MRLRESGMPDEAYWESLFDIPGILEAFGLGPGTGDVAELGCGYGTFTLPLAARIGGTVHTIDIDPGMVARSMARAQALGRTNISARLRDVLADGFGVPPSSCDAVLLFNILHGEQPVELLRAARDAVRSGGLGAVIHWRTDIETPRGPPAAIRPTAEQILGWSGQAGGFTSTRPPFLLPPWHYGISLVRDPVA